LFFRVKLNSSLQINMYRNTQKQTKTNPLTPVLKKTAITFIALSLLLTIFATGSSVVTGEHYSGNYNNSDGYTASAITSFFQTLFGFDSGSNSEPILTTEDNTPIEDDVAVTATLQKDDTSSSQATTNEYTTNEYVSEEYVTEEYITNEYITLSGVSEEYLDQKLEQLNNKLLGTIYDFTSSNQKASASNFTAIALTNKIDQLDSINISNTTIIGGTLTDTTISGGTLTDTAVSGGTGSFSTLTVNGLATALYFTATSTTATSTFAAGIQSTYLDITGTSASSTFANGITLTGGCVEVNGTCLQAGGSGTVGSGTQGQTAFYNVTGTDLIATSSLYVAQSGNVGIGTTSPYAKLSVTETLSNATGDETAVVIDYTVNKATSGNDTGLLINQTDTASPGTSSLIDAQVGGVSRFYVNNTAGVTVDGVGDEFFNVKRNGGLGTSITWNGVYLQKDGVFSISDSAPISNTALSIKGSGGDQGGFQIGFVTNTKTSGSQEAFRILRTYNQTSGTAANTDLLINRIETALGSGAQRLLDLQVGGISQFNVSNTGLVGIGTTSPYAKLSVEQGVGGTGDLFAIASSSNGTATTTHFVVDSLGNVGIGTAVPYYPFSVRTTAVDSIVGDFRNGTNGIEIGMADFGGNGVGRGIWGDGNALGLNNFSGPIIFQTAISSTPVERMRIDNVGNVGIGTTSPYAKLSVVGETVSEYFTATSTTATSTFAGGLAIETSGFVYDYSSNNVGIGTAAPTSTIHATTTLSDAAGNEIAYQLNYTTDKLTSGNDTGLLINMTDTASPGTSLLLDIQVGGVSKFSVDNTGVTKGAAFNANIFSDAAGFNFIHTDLNKILGISNNTTLIMQTRNFSSADNAIEMVTGTWSNTSGQANSVAILPTYNQTSGTAANTDLLINRTETALGSGSQYLIDAQVDGISQFNVSNTGLVGIGTTSPYAKLSIEQGVGGTGDLFAIASSSNGTATTTHFVVDSLGNVGIGTESPDVALHIEGDPAILRLVDGGAVAELSMQTSTDEFRILTAQALGFITFSPGSDNELVRLTSAGFFGISTTSPFAELSIEGQGSVAAFAVSDTSNNTDFIIDSAGLVGVGTVSPLNKLHITGALTGTAASTIPILRVDNTGNSFAKMVLTDSVNYDAVFFMMNDSTEADAKLRMWVGNALDNVEDGEGITVDGIGKIGIGTTTPFARLSVHGTSEDTTPLFYVASTTQGVATTTAFVIDANGNVGIGTESPLSKLHIGSDPGNLSTGIAFGDGNSGIYERGDNTISMDLGATRRWEWTGSNFFYVSGGLNAGIQTGASLTVPGFTFGTDTNTGIGGDNADGLSLITGGSSRIFLDSSGLVGIGTTSPYAKLSIEQGVGGTGDLFAIASSSNGTATTTHFVVDSLGNVGVGTDSPTTALTVEGQITVDPSGNFGATTGIMFGDGNTGFYEVSDNALNVLIANSAIWTFQSNLFGASAVSGPWLLTGTFSATAPTVAPQGADPNTGVGAADSLS